MRKVFSRHIQLLEIQYSTPSVAAAAATPSQKQSLGGIAGPESRIIDPPVSKQTETNSQQFREKNSKKLQN